MPENVTRMEATLWAPNPKVKLGKPKSESVKLFESIKPGEVMRLYHYDVSCSKEGGCTLAKAIFRAKENGWLLEYYQTRTHRGAG